MISLLEDETAKSRLVEAGLSLNWLEKMLQFSVSPNLVVNLNAAVEKRVMLPDLVDTDEEEEKQPATNQPDTGMVDQA